MKWLTIWLESILKTNNAIYFFLKIIFIIFIFISFKTLAKETWVLDKNLSTISFRIPVLMLKDVVGEFKEIEGLVEIDTKNKKDNKAIFSVKIDSIDINYIEYKELLMSETFFSANKFPIALVDTGKFFYEDEKQMDLDVELNIKGLEKIIPIKVEVLQLAEELVQIKSKLEFSRTEFNIGTGKWSSTAILRDKASIIINLFLFKK